MVGMCALGQKKCQQQTIMASNSARQQNESCGDPRSVQQRCNMSLIETAYTVTCAEKGALRYVIRAVGGANAQFMWAA